LWLCEPGALNSHFEAGLRLHSRCLPEGFSRLTASVSNDGFEQNEKRERTGPPTASRSFYVSTVIVRSDPALGHFSKKEVFARMLIELLAAMYTFLDHIGVAYGRSTESL